jgi:hypothetical protein
MLRVPDFIPVERGVKVTVAVQEPPGASVPQLWVWKKVPALAVKREIELTLRFPPPVLLMVTVLDTVWRTLTLPKSKATGETLITGLPPAPAWVTVKVCPAAVIVPVREELPERPATE